MAIVVGLAGVYIVLSVVLWALQEKITFPAPRGALPDPLKTLGYGEQVELSMHDGTKLVGAYYIHEKNKELSLFTITFAGPCGLVCSRMPSHP